MALTEAEIYETIAERFRLASEECTNLSRLNGGYVELRRHLKFLEGACRQMSVWREDSRWLAIAMVAARAQADAPQWIRQRQYMKFRRLAEALGSGSKAAKQLLTQATGRKSGAILPDALPAPHRQNKPMSIILPDGYKSKMH